MQQDENSQKSTCGKQCDICEENALIKCHYLFLKSTAGGGETFPDSCSHKHSQWGKQKKSVFAQRCPERALKDPCVGFAFFCKTLSSLPLYCLQIITNKDND